MSLYNMHGDLDNCSLSAIYPRYALNVWKNVSPFSEKREYNTRRYMCPTYLSMELTKNTKADEHENQINIIQRLGSVAETLESAR